MGLEPVGTGHPLLVVLVALVPAAILVVLGTLLSNAVQYVSRRLAHLVPRRVAILGGLVIVGVVTSSLFSGVLLRGALHAADAFFLGLDQVAGQFGEPPPADPLKSGSAASLIPWSTIGRDGRLYVETASTGAEITALTRRPAKEPLRVYVGLRSGDTTEKRAQLALQELRRVGAFDRRVLVIIMPVGTGWVDPPSIGALEYLEDGDVASVSLQYSYLVSPLSLVIEPDYGTDAAQALFEAVYRYWTSLPRDTRPRLYLNGLSLGAHASQASTRFLDVIGDAFNGALWAGPPFSSPIWTWATRTRDPESPAWRPRFGDDRSIRFANRGADLVHPPKPDGRRRHRSRSAPGGAPPWDSLGRCSSEPCGPAHRQRSRHGAEPLQNPAVLLFSVPTRITVEAVRQEALCGMRTSLRCLCNQIAMPLAAIAGTASAAAPRISDSHHAPSPVWST